MQPSGSRDGWRRWWVAAVEAGAAVGLVDAAVAMGRFGERLPSPHDRLAFSLSLASICALASALAALAACGVWAATQRVPPRFRPAIGQAGAIIAGILLGFALFSGTAMRRSPGRPWAILACAALASLLAQVLGPRVARARISPLFRVGLLSASAGLYLLHAFAYVRLYPGVHAFCAAGAVATLIAAIAYGVREPISVPVVLVTVAVAAGGAAGGANLRHAQAQRALAAHRAPIAGYAVRAIDALVPHEAVTGVVADPHTPEGPSLDLRGRDLVLVTVDALRADRIGAYGARSGLTPALDALAADGVVFERAYCTTPHTSYSIASLMTGKYIRELSALGPPTKPHDTLAGLLGRAGYRTAGFFPPAIFQVDEDRLGELSARRLDFADVAEGYVDAGPRVEQVSRWLDRVPAGQRVFVWVHFFEPHEPYEAHAGQRAGATSTSAPAIRYDAEVAAVDDAFRRLRETLASHGRSPAWVVTADHGEEFGDHGGRFHGTTLYDEQIRVPMIIAAPGLAPARVTSPVSLIDLAPTMLAGTGLAPPARMRGRDLGGVIASSATSTAVFASVEGARAVIVGQEKLICDRGGGPCELFDLGTDAREVDNLVDVRTARVRELSALLEGWTGTHGRMDQDRAAPSFEHSADIDTKIERALQGDATVAAPLARALADAPAGPNARRASQALVQLAITGHDASGFDRTTVIDALVPTLGAADAAVRRDASVALALLGDARGLPGTIESLDSGELSVRRAAALGAALLHRHEGSTLLGQWALEPHAAGRDRAANALASLRDPSTLGTWVALLDDPALSPIAARALGDAGDPSAIPALERAAARTPYALTLDAAVRALAALHATSAAHWLAREIAFPDLAPGVGETMRMLDEPGRAMPGTQWPRGLSIDPVHPASVALRGTLPTGGVFALVALGTEGVCRIRVDGVTGECPIGTRQVRVALPGLGPRVRLESDGTIRVLSVTIVARER